ncbi:MAG: nucleoside hydrolase [Rubrobacter sp.]|nr:nucleoside hydrolase [Rubrobacter sp.]
MRAPVVIDTDPGRDDAVALMLACGAPGLDVRAVTTVAGNVSLRKTTRNALRLLTLIGREDIPVAAGAEKPLYRELLTAEHVHGESGIAGPELPEPSFEPDRRDAVSLIADVLESSDQPVTLVPIGPLTNIATLFDRRPELREKVGRIVMMGGSVGAGNTTAAAEFNVYVDPEAAREVFDIGLPVSMVGLDVTRQARADEDVLERLRSAGAIGKAAASLLVEPDWMPRRDAHPPVHDAVAVAAALEPELLRTLPMRVEVECAGEHTTGETVCDANGVGGREPNAEVGVGVDAGRVFEILLDSIERL